MKVGDRVYCKENYYINSNTFINGHNYIIEEMCKISTVKKINVDICRIKNIYFLLNADDQHNFSSKESSPYIYDYFMSEQEYRKEKLKKINESWR